MRRESIIKQRALQAGFDLAGIAGPAALKDLEFLAQWVQKGYGGEMHYLADPRRKDPRQVLPSVQSIICVGLIYNTPFPYSTDITGPAKGEKAPSFGGMPMGDAGPRAWISRYAWGKDYHEIMRSKLEKLRTAVEELAPGVETRVYVDTGPVVERAFARLSGIGWVGKNTCLINEQKGSWFFLGVILTNLELELDVAALDRCGSCTRCLEACPTGALVEPYVMDGSRCISYFNIELRGAIPEKFRAAMGKNVFGCDICQDVCPWNNRPLSFGSVPAHDETPGHEQPAPGFPPVRAGTSNLAEFRPAQFDPKPHQAFSEFTEEGEHAAPFPAIEQFSLCNPPLEALASMSEDDFRRVFARSPIKRAKYRGWLRNLCVAMGNSGDGRFIPWLTAVLEGSDPVLHEHATWALGRLGRQLPHTKAINEDEDNSSVAPA